MAHDIKVPQIAEGADSATVTEILVSEGESIQKDQSMIVVESDKASVEIPSPESGTVQSINVGEGDEVKVGDVILSLETSGSEETPNDKHQDEEEKESKPSKKEEKELKTDDGATSQKSDSYKENTKKETEGKPSDEGDSDLASEEEEKQAPESKETSTASPAQKAEDDRNSDDAKQTQQSDVGVAPGVRRLARELGIDLNQVEGSGKAGHISKEDVKAHAKQTSAETGHREYPPLPDFSQWGDTESKSLSGIRSTTAKNVSLAWSTIPHVFQFDEAEISGIEKYIDKHEEKASSTGGKLTLTAVLVKIVAEALRHFPKFNASIDMANEQMILKKYVNIGIAVDTEKGLLVPVLKNADRKSIIAISEELTELAAKARKGKLDREEMQGGNFTISNLGGIGGTQFTPIILHPQVAILGVSRAAKKPVYLDGKFGARNILPLSLSYDHRLIDGAEGVRFIDWIARALEDPYSALLEG